MARQSPSTTSNTSNNHNRRRSSLSAGVLSHGSASSEHHDQRAPSSSGAKTALHHATSPLSHTTKNPGTWGWSSRRRSTSIGAAEHQRLQSGWKTAQPTPSNGNAGSGERRREDSAIVVGNGGSSSGSKGLKSPSTSPRKLKKGPPQDQVNPRDIDKPGQQRTWPPSLLQLPTSPTSPTRVPPDPPPLLLPPIGGRSATGRGLKSETSPAGAIGLGVATIAAEPYYTPVGGSPLLSPPLSPPARSPIFGEQGLSVESRYSRRGSQALSASPSQDNISLRSAKSGRTASPYLNQGPPTLTIGGAVGGRGDDAKSRLAADMSGRGRSMSSGNVQQPNDAYSNYNTESTSERRDGDDRESAPRGKDRREQDKKTMLSKALQKAHTAVLLDNAHNFEGAIEAYDDACRLLGQVLIRSAGEDDRRKLDAIRTTYTNRIEELHQINREAAQANGKGLPARPMSDESLSASAADTPHSQRSSVGADSRSEQIPNGQLSSKTRSSANTLASQQSVRTESSISSPPKISEPPKQLPPSQPPPSKPTPPIPNGLPLRSQNAANEQLQPTTFKATEQYLTIGSPMDASYASYAPPPLSPRRLPSEKSEQPNAQLQAPQELASKGHSRANSNNSTSWLDTIDESGASSDGSSVHSLGDDALNRKHMRVPSGDTEAEFDAALDAAVEAAYADGTEPYDFDEPALDYSNTALSEPVKQMVDTERKRLSDRSQMIQQAHARTKQLTKSGQFAARQSRDMYRMSDDVEEERILEEIQKDFGFDFGLGSKSSAPRESDSSQYSGASTYHSSMSSSKATALTSLSTVNETQDASSLHKPSQNLPRLSEESNQREPSLESQNVQVGAPPPLTNNASGVRSRRMSGQNTKQLKIETSMPPKKNLPQPPPTAPPTTIRVDDALSAKPLTAKSDTQLLPESVFQGSITATTPILPQTFVTQSSPQKEMENASARDALPTPTTPSAGLGLSNSPNPATSKERPGLLKKNKSSISLKTRNMSVSSPGSDVDSVGTPLSTTFTTLSNNSRKNLAYKDSAIPPTPGVPAFGDPLTQTQSNVNLFDSDMHSPYVPGSPNPMAANAPIPLEPCPDSHLLRPYWLMRCFYQTIAHPRGGYLSTKLFVPRDVWRVKGVKIKAMEEKIMNLDFLTAGLQKLNNVDSFDAAAVLEEMQQFEVVLDTVQANLQKKLGSEVSVQGIQTLFKDAPASAGETASATEGGSRAVTQGKSFLSSMRKLRSKSSAVALTPSTRDPGGKELLTMSTLPMTNLANPRFAKRDPSKLEVSGPHAQYMESLAKLCDAVQVIDQVARQVEDPGLKHSSPTHVGLELSTRHASEFFGFYVCRFVLADLTMLLDKFIKRGSEWVVV